MVVNREHERFSYLKFIYEVHNKSKVSHRYFRYSHYYSLLYIAKAYAFSVLKDTSAFSSLDFEAGEFNPIVNEERNFIIYKYYGSASIMLDENYIRGELSLIEKISIVRVFCMFQNIPANGVYNLLKNDIFLRNEDNPTPYINSKENKNGNRSISNIDISNYYNLEWFTGVKNNIYEIESILNK